MTRNELVMVLVCGVCAVVAMYYALVAHPGARVARAGRVELGTVRPRGPDVRVRGELDNEFSTVPGESKVYRNDRLFTGPTSTAHVQLNNKDELTLEPNSLILISDDSGHALNLEAGSFVAKFGPASRLTLGSTDQPTRLTSDGATFRVEAQRSGPPKLTVLTGAVALVGPRGTEPRRINANESAVVGAVGVMVKAHAITLAAPAAAEVMFTGRGPVKFAWTVHYDGPARGAVRATVEISSDPRFSENVLSAEVDQPMLSRALPPGAYYWRVKLNDAVGSASPTSSFTLYDPLPPMVSSGPPLLIDVNARNQSREPISFAWTDPTPSTGYLFEMSEDREFKNIARSISTKQTQVAVPSLKVGSHFWRVTSTHPSRRDLTSDVAEITLHPRRSKEPPPAPRLAARPPAPIRPLVESPKPRREVAAVTPPQAVPAPPETTAPRPAIKPWVKIGGGLNSARVRQTADVVPAVEFTAAGGTSYSVRAGIDRGRFGIEAGFSRGLGSIVTENVAIASTALRWQSLSLEGKYRVYQGSDDRHLGVDLRAGVFVHRSPYFAVNDEVLSVNSFDFTTLAAGVGLSYLTASHLRFDATARVERGLTSTDQSGRRFEPRSIEVLAGALGAEYLFARAFSVGVRWTAQLQKNRYALLQTNGVEASGAQSLLFSDVELNLGHEF